MTPKQRNPTGSSWRVRRWMMFIVVAFCMWVVGYILVKDRISGVADTLGTMAFLTIISIVGSYVFGATWEDMSLSRLKSKAAEPPSE